MLLRESGRRDDKAYNVASVTSDDDPGVAHAEPLRALTEAAINGDWSELDALRTSASEKMGAQKTVDALVVAAAFNGITRVADATGIPLDPATEAQTGDMRAATGIDAFDYSNKSARYD